MRSALSGIAVAVLAVVVLAVDSVARGAPRDPAPANVVLMPAMVGAAGGAAGGAVDDALYTDPDAQSSATITQVLPNSQTTQMNLTNVRSIHIRQGILVINWGGTATTLLPNQYVTGITVNKRASTPANGQTAPATPAIPSQP